VTGEIFEKAEFCGGGLDLLFANGQGHGTAIDDEIAVTNDLGSERTFKSSKNGLDAGDEFARAERLWNVIVGAEFESEDAIGFATFGGEKDHGRHGESRILTDSATKLETVSTGNHDVENEKYGAFTLGFGHDQRGRSEGSNRVSSGFEVMPDKPSDVGFIFHHKQDWAHEIIVASHDGSSYGPKKNLRACNNRSGTSVLRNGAPIAFE
jgi:hypothetical protein